MSFYLREMCCLCLNVTEDLLQDLNSKSEDNLTHFEKISSCLSRLTSTIETDSDYMICERCSDIINMVYEFNKVCFRNLNKITSYRKTLKAKSNKQKCCSLTVTLERINDIASEKMNDDSENEESNDFSVYEEDSSSDYLDESEIEMEENDMEKYFDGNNDKLEGNQQKDAKERRALKKNVPIGIVKKKVHRCDVCDKVFNNKKQLNIHKRVHTGERPFRCDLCGKLFKQRSHLNRHMLTHTGVKAFKCKICRKSFATKSNLNEHKLIHFKEKHFSCDICQKAFRHKSTMVAHKRVHTGERPYECERCRKTFRTATILRVHERVHTGEKPYHCAVCNKSFSTYTGIKYHENRYNH